MKPPTNNQANSSSKRSTKTVVPFTTTTRASKAKAEAEAKQIHEAAPPDAAPTDAAPTDAAPTDAAPTDAAPTNAAPFIAPPPVILYAEPFDPRELHRSTTSKDSSDQLNEDSNKSGKKGSSVSVCIHVFTPI